MRFGLKNRRFIHFSLIVCTILIQLIILLFFYNEYFNERKLTVIWKQLEDTRMLKQLTDNSRKELTTARSHLHKYLADNQREDLEMYFQSLRNLNGNIDSIKSYENTFTLLKSENNSVKRDFPELGTLEGIIDSVYSLSKENRPSTDDNFQIKKVEIDKGVEKFEMEITHTTDSIEKKKFFPRVFDAIKGDVPVQRDTVYIKTKYGSTIDTSQIKRDFDSTLTAIDKHYRAEIEKYKSHLSAIHSTNNSLYRIYDNLMSYSNTLMEIYDAAVKGLNSEIEKAYLEQSSVNNKIRRITVLGLMVLTFFVLIVLMYYTRQSFVYEKELKEANQLAIRNLNFKNRILGMLSHEVRSPLKIINIFIDRISRKANDKQINHYLDSIKFTNDSLVMQANQILEYAKNQERKIELQAVKFNLRSEIEALINSFKPYIESKGNDFKTQNDVPDDLVVFSDKIKIHQVFINLLGNANKFTENGEIVLLAKTTEPIDGKLKLLVSIHDSGYGISEADLQMIFEPYYQGMMAEELENIGAGLGLNLCKEIVTLFGGNILVKSSLGKGTQVDFEMKLNLSND